MDEQPTQPLSSVERPEELPTAVPDQKVEKTLSLDYLKGFFFNSKLALLVLVSVTAGATFYFLRDYLVTSYVVPYLSSACTSSNEGCGFFGLVVLYYIDVFDVPLIAIGTLVVSLVTLVVLRLLRFSRLLFVTSFAAVIFGISNYVIESLPLSGLGLIVVVSVTSGIAYVLGHLIFNFGKFKLLLRLLIAFLVVILALFLAPQLKPQAIQASMQNRDLSKLKSANYGLYLTPVSFTTLQIERIEPADSWTDVHFSNFGTLEESEVTTSYKPPSDCGPTAPIEGVTGIKDPCHLFITTPSGTNIYISTTVSNAKTVYFKIGNTLFTLSDLTFQYGDNAPTNTYNNQLIQIADSLTSISAQDMFNREQDIKNLLVATAKTVTSNPKFKIYVPQDLPSGYTIDSQGFGETTNPDKLYADIHILGPHEISLSEFASTVSLHEGDSGCGPRNPEFNDPLGPCTFLFTTPGGKPIYAKASSLDRLYVNDLIIFDIGSTQLTMEAGLYWTVGTETASRRIGLSKFIDSMKEVSPDQFPKYRSGM